MVQSGITVARGLIACVIWTAYMVKSQRVAATFVRDGAIPAQPATITAASAL